MSIEGFEELSALDGNLQNDILTSHLPMIVFSNWLFAFNIDFSSFILLFIEYSKSFNFFGICIFLMTCTSWLFAFDVFDSLEIFNLTLLLFGLVTNIPPCILSVGNETLLVSTPVTAISKRQNVLSDILQETIEDILFRNRNDGEKMCVTRTSTSKLQSIWDGSWISFC